MEIQQEFVMKTDEKQLMHAAEYVTMQCVGCSDSPKVLFYKVLEIMKDAARDNKNPYKALNDFLGTNVDEIVLMKM